MSERVSLKVKLDEWIESGENEFQKIWDEIGICSEVRSKRIDVVVDHVKTLLGEMIAEENGLKLTFLESINGCTENIAEISKELNIPVFSPPDGLTVLQLEKELRFKLDELSVEKHKRLKKLKKLRQENKALSASLGVEPFFIPNINVPSEEFLSQIEVHTKTLIAEKDNRLKTFYATKNIILDLFRELERNPTMREISLYDDENLILSLETLEKLKNLQEDLAQLNKDKHSQAIILRETLAKIWDRLQIDQCERDKFVLLYPGHKPTTIKANSFSEELLDLHILEVDKLKMYLEENKDLLYKWTRRNQLWSQMTEFEKRANDPNRFNNRGGGLLSEEKERKKLLKDLPKLERELESLALSWETSHGKIFRVNGERLVDVITTDWENYRAEKENEKAERQKAKMKQIEDEMYKGCKTMTPSKRKLETPKSTRKRLLVDQSSATSRTLRAHSSLSHHHTPGSVRRLPRSAKIGNKPPINRRRKSRTAPSGTILGRSGSKENFNSTNYTVVNTTGISLASTVDTYGEFTAAIAKKAEKDTCRSSCATPGKSPRKANLLSSIMATVTCDVCGGSDFHEQDGMTFCRVCNSQSQFVSQAQGVEVFQTNLKVHKAVTASRRQQKLSTQETINYYSKWTTNEAFNIILKRLVDILVKMGADPRLEKVVFQLWVLYLRKTKFAFCKPIYQTKEWKPKIPVIPRERDKQVLFENKTMIEARKFRKSFLQTLANKKIQKRFKATVILSGKKLQGVDEPEAEPEVEEMEIDDDTVTKSELEIEKLDNDASKKSEKEKPKRKRNYLTSWNSVSVRTVGIIGRMTMERLLEMLFLGLLLVHKRVLLCDLLGWIESSELPIHECSHLLPETMKFQTADNTTFRFKNMPSHYTIRRNTCKLAKFLDIHTLPEKCLVEIVKRFVLALNLPDEMNDLVASLIALDPPQMPCNNTDKKRTYPIPNYEGRAIGYIVVVLKLIFGLNGKTELKQSIYAKKLASLAPGENIFVWEDWALATEKTFELIRRKNIFQNIDCLESYTDVDKVVNYYLKTAQFHKGRLTDNRLFTYAYWRDDVRNAVRAPILSLIPELEGSMENVDEAGTTVGSGVFNWSAFCDSVTVTKNENDDFHNATFKHLIDPMWVQDLLEPNNVSLDVRKTTGFEETESAEQPESLTVYHPFHEYSFNHYWRSKRGSFNFAVFDKLPRTLVWLLDVCARCGRMPSEILYEEVMLIERVLIKSSDVNVEPKFRLFCLQLVLRVMVKFYEGSYLFKFSWDQVAKGFWQRYPNPYSHHVLTEDVVAREIQDNKLFSLRLLTKTNRVPKWGERFLSSRNVSIIEESVVDPINRTITTYTRNVGYTRVMGVEEKCVYKQSKDNPTWTIVERQAWISSGMFGFARAIEVFGLDRFRKNSQRAMSGFQMVLERLYSLEHTAPATSIGLLDATKLKERAKKATELAKSRAKPLVAACQSGKQQDTV
uniref:PRELI/MSF1 domain-containing protein n=1 Tax=Strigamia maritima TaxID=126957 RepID=T1J8R0_STRMM